MPTLAISDAKREAAKVLDTYWMGQGLPVDPAAIADAMGIDVRQANLPDNMAAALIKQRGGAPIILLSASDHSNRQRFSCAHEIGHYVQRAGSQEDYNYVDLRDVLASEGTDPVEKFANHFAANLLMPEDEVRSMFKSSKEVWLLAQGFAVSPEAMNFRLVNLGLLP